MSLRALIPTVVVQFSNQQTKDQEMEWLFGRKKTPEEMLRENQRSLKKAMRFCAIIFMTLPRDRFQLPSYI